MTDKPNIFLKKVWGMFPSSWPVVSCHYKGSAESLIDQAKPGDLILHVISETIRTDQSGLAVGLAEFAHEIVNTEDFIDKKYFDIKECPNNFTEKGEFKWKYSVPILRAWEFHKPIPYRILFEQHKKEYDSKTQSGYAKLYSEDVNIVLDLGKDEILFSEKMSLEENTQSIGKNIISKSSAPSRGPTPYLGERQGGETKDGINYTYAFRFGNRAVWKIGYSQNLQNRLNEINTHIPCEVLKEQWCKGLSQEWESAGDAYNMEQEILKLLKDKHTKRERVACSKGEIETAWAQAIVNCRKA